MQDDDAMSTPPLESLLACVDPGGSTGNQPALHDPCQLVQQTTIMMVSSYALNICGQAIRLLAVVWVI